MSSPGSGLIRFGLRKSDDQAVLMPSEMPEVYLCSVVSSARQIPSKNEIDVRKAEAFAAHAT